MGCYARPTQSRPAIYSIGNLVFFVELGKEMLDCNRDQMHKSDWELECQTLLNFSKGSGNHLFYRHSCMHLIYPN
jgi:hypothetical protein